MESRMSDATIIEQDIIPVATDESHSPFSWSAAIAGALAAIAVTLIIIALGSGIGLSFASPYAGPSATALSIGAAVWLVMAQTMGFATGGYLAGRLRSPAHDDVVGETAFRDAAQGFIVWALGVVAMVALAGLLGLVSLGATVHMVAGTAAGSGTPARSDTAAVSAVAAPTDYFVDVLLRPRVAGTNAGGSATVGVGGPATRPALDAETRAEVTRIFVRGLSEGGIDDSDRAYLAQVVSARTGLPPDEAERRVAEVETKARETVKQAADTAAKAGAMFSFWTFMALLFGGAAATLAGMLGGQLRDDEGRLLAAAD
jgi:hypothetical protein